MRQIETTDQTGEPMIVTEGHGFLTLRDPDNIDCFISTREAVEVPT